MGGGGRQETRVIENYPYVHRERNLKDRVTNRDLRAGMGTARKMRKFSLCPY